MLRKIVLLLVFAFCAFHVTAQSSQKISELLEFQNLTNGQASYLIASCMGLVEENASDEDSYKVLVSEKLFKESNSPDQLLTLAKAAHLCVKSSGIKGGLLYSIFHNDRYAFRELKALGIIPVSMDPSVKVSGTDLIALMNCCDEKAGKK